MLAPPPPPATAARSVAFFDTECYPNYWLLKFRPRGCSPYAFRLRAGERFADVDIARMRLLFEAYTVISFNGLRYDVPMLISAFMGYTAEQLKWQNDRIIVEKVKPWELGLPEWTPVDHIDIMEVIPGAGSQKLFAGRIHYKTMRDLPYEPSHFLTEAEIVEVDAYCENDLGQLEALYEAVAPQLRMREMLSKRYGIDLRSKSDAQVAEAVLKHRCEQATGRRIFKPNIDWSLKFRFKVPEFIAYQLPQLQHALAMVRESIFTINPPKSMYGGRDAEAKGKCVPLPPQLEGLTVTIGQTTYKLGIGGLHSQEKSVAFVSDENYQIRMPDVASYYPKLIINSGEVPPALGSSFAIEYEAIVDERLDAKALAKKLEKGTPEQIAAATAEGGGKIMINGSFGKTGSPYSVLFAPEMLIQTTVSGQLSILMLIEWLEHCGIPVVSANTDGIVIKCPRHLIPTSDWLIAEWEKRTSLTMETEDYVALYARDVNAYFAIKTPDDIKRKGEYAKASLIMKKSPDTEICSDAVADYLAKGIPIEYTIAASRDITKFVTIQNVAGGAVKMWGDGPRKGARVMDMVATLTANGWIKAGRKWVHLKTLYEGSAHDAYQTCFQPQRPEYLGKAIRWYYGTKSPGPIVYASNGNLVGGSYGATPCMTLPDEFPDDIDYSWYVKKAEQILLDIGK